MKTKLDITLALFICMIAGNAAAAIDGDANGDNTVNLDDFVIVKQNFGMLSGATVAEGDFDGDGDVDLDDFVILKQNFGLTGPTGETYLIDGDPADVGLRADGTDGGVGTSSERVGDETAPGDQVLVLVFQLPTLPEGEAITGADLQVDYNTAKAPTTFNIDLYGLPYRSAATVLATDYYQGAYDGDASATALQQGFFTPAAVVGPIHTDSLGDFNLATYLNIQYIAGATGGDYVFLRLSHDVADAPNWRWYQISTADSSTDGPMLTIMTGEGGDPVPIAPMANAGPDQELIDTDGSGDEAVTLDGSASYDPDGTIESYVWTEGASQIATGETPMVTLGLGGHSIELTVTDNDDETDSDTVVITVSAPIVPGEYYVDQGSPGASDSNNGAEGSPWKTIQHAVDNVGAGDTIFVKAGIYREDVGLDVSGTSANPITLKAYPGDRPVISGGSRITGWTQCTSADAGGNPNYANIYYTTVDYRLTTLHQDNVRRWKGRAPEHGFWYATGGSGSSLVDTVNLNQVDDYWNGGEMYNRYAPGEDLITNFVSSTGTLTIQGAGASSGDPYWIQNLVELINEPSEWAIEDIGGGSYRVYYWAVGDGDPDNYLMESPDPDITLYSLFSMGSENYWIVDGFEIRHGWSTGIYNGGNYNIVQNCLIHHHGGVGVSEVDTIGSIYRNNAILHMGVMSGTGVKLLGTNGALFEENEIAWNYKDGMKLHDRNLTLRRNYIHGHWMYGHPDNLQTTVPGLNGLLLEDNFIWDSGQSYMTDNLSGAFIMRNNVIGGAYSSSLPWGRGTDADSLTMESNTWAFSGDSHIAGTADATYNWSDNIFYQGHANHVASMNSTADFSSDYNLFFFADGVDDMDSPVVLWDRGFSARGLAQYQNASGQDANSLFADPMFTNAPVYLCTINFYDNIRNITATRVYINSEHAAYFDVGDNIEIDFDGVVRTITAKGAGGSGTYLEFAPGDPRIQYKATRVANWKTATDFTLDLTPAAGSPALGGGSGGGDIGSTISTVDYMNCDFDGDGTRDVPEYVEEPGLSGYGPW